MIAFKLSHNFFRSLEKRAAFDDRSTAETVRTALVGMGKLPYAAEAEAWPIRTSPIGDDRKGHVIVEVDVDPDRMRRHRSPSSSA